MTNLILLFFLIFSVGGSLLLINYDPIFAQSTDFQMPSLSFDIPYSDMPSNMQDSLSELDEINDDVDSQVNEIIKPTFQNPVEKSVTNDNDDISPVLDSTSPGTADGGGGGSGEVYVVDYENIRVQKFDSQGNFILKWGAKGKADGLFGVPHGIDVDKERNVYVVDMDNNSVQKFDSQGNFLLRAYPKIR